MTGTGIRVVELPTGIAMRVQEGGQGFPLVLVHGVGASLDNWDGIARLLEPHFRVIRLDLRGHGGTTRAPGPYSVELFAADLLALLDALGIGRCHLAGHSLGGIIAQRFAIDHPGRLDRLVLLSAIADRTPEESARVLARVETIRNGTDGEHFRRSLPRWFTDGFLRDNPDLIETYLARNARNDPACYAAAYYVLATAELGPELHRIVTPTLVVTGEEDLGSNPRMARFMAREIAGAQLRILPGLRHSILIEAPETVAGLMLGFLRPGPDGEGHSGWTPGGAG